MGRFKFLEFLPTFTCVGNKNLDLVLVGGQAVNCYAQYLLPQYFRTEVLERLVSKDADFLGTEGDAIRLAKALEAPWISQKRVFALGHMFLPNQIKAKVEVLHRVRGADYPQARASAYRIVLPGGTQLSIMNPLLLYMVKGACAVKIHQRVPDRPRQDTQHFEVMSLVIHLLLRQFCMAGSPKHAQAIIETCEQLLEFWLSPIGAALMAGGAVDPAKTLPIHALSIHPGDRVRGWVKKRWPTFPGRELTEAVNQVPLHIVEKVRTDFQNVLTSSLSDLGAGTAT